VRLDPDQRDAVLWGSSAGALLVAQQVAGKATRDALFLSNHPATLLPVVTMAAALAAVASALGTARLLAVRPPQRVVPALAGLHAALLLGQFLVALVSPGVAGVLLYLEVAASGGILSSGYWSIVNERFDPWTAKKVMGRLGLGASLGGVAGGLLALAVSTVAPLPAMLLLTAALNVGAVVGLVRLGAHARGARTPPRGRSASPISTLRSVPYLRLIALVVVLGAITEVLLDYVLKARAASTLAPGQELMSFFAAYHTVTGLLALACQLALVHAALERLGLAGTVALRPLAVAASAAVGLVDPRLWAAALGRGSHDVLSNSLFRSGYELLYTPVAGVQKRSTKQLVDVAFDKMGALLGGAASLAAVRLLVRPEGALLGLAGALSLVALSLTRRLKGGYVSSLESGLRAGRVDLQPEDVVDSTTRLTLSHVGRIPVEDDEVAEAAGDPLLARIADLRSGDTGRLRRALAAAAPPDLALVPHVVALVSRNDVYVDALHALRRFAERTTGQILDALLDESTDVVVRRRLPRALKAAPTPRAVEGLLRGLDDPDLGVRAACSAALAALLSRFDGLSVPPPVAFAAAARELARPADPGLPTDARLAHVFALLSLALDREPLRIAARAVRGSDASLRGTALEYLENVLPPEVRKPLFRQLAAEEAPRGRSLDEVLTVLLRTGHGSATREVRLRRLRLRTRG
jgi:AAA family ATP:ADP antiporter